MRNVPILKGRRRVNRRDSAWPAALAILLGGCLFELAELAPPLGGAGGGAGVSGLGGAMLGGGGGGPGGSTNGGSGAGGSPCSGGLTLCGGTCVEASIANGCGDPSCLPCASSAGDHVIVACDSDRRQCIVEGCDPGYADCNGDVVGDVGMIQGDGCEYSFGTVAASTQPLPVPLAQIQIDGNRSDWSDVPAYLLQETCRTPEGTDCRQDDTTPEVLAQNEVPLSRDLAAYFRVAWDQDFLYVLGEAFDNHLFASGETVNEPRCQMPPERFPACEDSFSVFLDGRADAGNGPDDTWNILALSSNLLAIDNGAPDSADLDFTVVPNGEFCYRVEAQLSWNFVVAASNQPQQGLFPPAEGQIYGFDISVSDWDPSASNEAVFQRQSHVFWKNPGNEYRFRTNDYGRLQLSTSPAGGDAGTTQ